MEREELITELMESIASERLAVLVGAGPARSFRRGRIAPEDPQRLERFAHLLDAFALSKPEPIVEHRPGVAVFDSLLDEFVRLRPVVSPAADFERFAALLDAFRSATPGPTNEKVQEAG